MYLPGGRLGIRNAPDPSETTVCSPYKDGEVAVTTTSARGFLFEASMTLPMRVPDPICARAWAAHRFTTMNATSLGAALRQSTLGGGRGCDRPGAEWTSTEAVESFAVLVSDNVPRKVIGGRPCALLSWSAIDECECGCKTSRA